MSTRFVNDIHYMSSNGLWWLCRVNNCWYPAVMVNGKLLPIAPLYRDVRPSPVDPKDVPTVLVS